MRSEVGYSTVREAVATNICPELHTQELNKSYLLAKLAEMWHCISFEPLREKDLPSLNFKI